MKTLALKNLFPLVFPLILFAVFVSSFFFFREKINFDFSGFFFQKKETNETVEPIDDSGMSVDPARKLEIFIAESDGHSMEPTIMDKEITRSKKANIEQVEQNNIIDFQCFHCNHGKEIRLLKRVIKINADGCLWVEGDNKPESTDSRSFGWLCPDDIKINGIVIGK